MYKKIMLLSALCILITPALAEDTAPADAKKPEHRQKMKERFQAIDLDGDGEINKAEFLAMSEKRFEKMDKDGNGQLSKKELRQMRKKSKGKKPMEE